MKRSSFMTWARFSLLSVVIVRCAHSQMRLFQSNSLKMDSQSQHCSNVSLEQLFPKTQFRSKSRYQTRQWPRRWWNRTKRWRRSSLTRSTSQIQWICKAYFETFKMHWWKKEIRMWYSIYIGIKCKLQKIYGLVHHYWFSRQFNTNKHVLTHLCVDLAGPRTQHPFLVLHPFPRCAVRVLKF